MQTSNRILRSLPHLALRHTPKVVLAVLFGWAAFPTILPLLVPHDSGHHLHAQDVYTELTDPQQIKIFTEVSDGLICQCGCHFVLSSCPHVECPWGIPVRRFVEIKIQEGMSAKTILEKMETGFGPEVRQYPLVQRFIEEGRDDIVAGLENGWGPGVSAHASPFGLIAVLVLTGVGSVLLFLYWWRRNSRKAAVGSAGPTKSDESLGDSESNRSAARDSARADRLRDLDR